MSGVILEVLFVPRKAETLSMIRRAVETMDIHLQVCTDPQEVERLLFCHRYDGLIVDHDESTEGILRALRQSPSNRGAIAIDVHDAEVELQTVFALGANFEMVSPFSVERARKTLHLAVGLMMLGRRRYYRHPVEIRGEMLCNGQPIEGWVTNVSESGVGIHCDSVALSAGPLHCSFTIPESSERISMEVTVIWADKTGQAGCRIEHITQGQNEYVEWIYGLFYRGPALRASLVATLSQEKHLKREVEI